MVGKQLEGMNQEEIIELLTEKKEALTYFLKDPSFLLKKFNIDELYELLNIINEKNFVDNFIHYIITKREDYYLFLNNNKKANNFDIYINKYILDILYRNYTLIQNGKGDKIENTILYGLREEQVLQNINAILCMAPNPVYECFLKELSSYPIIFNVLRKNSSLIIEKLLYKEKLFPYVKQMKANGYSNITTENEDVILSKIVKIRLATLKEENLLLPLQILMQELLEKTNVKMEDIIYVNSGSYSDFYQIGNLGIKVGTKINEKIPYHPRFLTPFLRRKIWKNIYLEVYKYVNTNIEVSNDEIYNIYKEFRENGIIWIDPRTDNVGKLLEDNDTNINGENIKIEKETVGFFMKSKQEILPKGELVILDVDTAVYEEDFSLEYYDKLGIDLRAYKKMEKRYQLEKKNKKRGSL